MAAGGGGMASPTQGDPTAISELLGAMSPDYQRQLQLKKLQEQQAMYQASQFQRDAILQQIQSNPALKSDPRVIQLLQGSYRGTGVNAPIQNAQAASPGLSTPQTQDSKLGTTLPGLNRPAQAAQPRQIDETALSGNTFPAWVQKNLQTIVNTPVEGRAAIAQGEGVPLGAREQQILSQIPYTPTTGQAAAMERGQASVETNTKNLLNSAMKNADFNGVKSAISFFQKASQRYGMDPTEFDGYMQVAIDGMTPKEVQQMALTASRIAKNDADAAATMKLLEPRVAQINAETERNKASANELNTLATQVQKLLPGKMSQTQAQTAKLLSDVARNKSVSNLEDQEARVYAMKAKSGALGANPAEARAAIASMSSGRNRAEANIASLTNAIVKAKATFGYGQPGNEALTESVNSTISDIQDQITQERSDLDQYKSSIDTLASTAGPAIAATPSDPKSNDKKPGGAAVPVTVKSGAEAEQLPVGSLFVYNGVKYVRTASAKGYAPAP